MDGRGAVFDRNFESVASDEGTVRWQVHRPILLNRLLHRTRDGVATHGIQDLEDFGHWPAGSFLPRPARHFFGDEIEEGDISRYGRANNGVANGVERDLRAFLFHEQCLVHDLTLDGITQRSHETGRVDLSFDEMFLRACLKDL